MVKGRGTSSQDMVAKDMASKDMAAKDMAAKDTSAPDAAAFERLIEKLRPQLHRYCARMTGSVIDGEDVLQEALLKAVEASPQTLLPTNPDGWLFRIAHNAAIDYLRRRARHVATHAEEDLDMIAAPTDAVHDRQIAAASLRTFMRLPVRQRSAVILRDVLGYSVEEVCDITSTGVLAARGALQRGRQRLRELAQEGDERPPPVLAEPERARLMAYIERFNARDFDSVRDMLAEDVRLDLVNRLRLKGRSDVSQYFHRYAQASHWHCVPGLVDRRPAILMFDPNDPAGPPTYFVLLEWTNQQVAEIRDFLFARYALEGAEIVALG
jgi:RNA polymerase sigma-70 factor, ECF subfamily